MSDGSVFRLVFDRSPAGMAILNAEGVVVQANSALSRLFDGEELNGRKLREIFGSNQAQLWDELLRRVNANPDSPEEMLLHCDTRERWLRLQLSRLDEVGEEQQLHLLAQDATEQQRSRERLERAKETAEKATRTKSAFLANMSHEIRTPLHTITGITELLLDTQLDDEQAEYGKQIRFSADVLLGLINDILDFSKIEAGKLSLENIEFDLLTMVEDAVDMVSLEAHRRGLEVITFLSPELPERVLGDPVRIRQIVVNLFNNATKFTSRGEIYLRVRPRTKDGHIQDLLFEVEDTGIGIAPEKRRRLFRAFSQVDDSTTRKYGGTGLGLSISKSLVGLMGGKIGVSSREGHGSTFWFTLPLPSTEDLPSARPEPFLAGRRLLLVDDNAHSRAVIERYLSALGADCVEVESGRTGLDMLSNTYAEQQVPFDAVLVDQEMPGMDGWHFASELRSMAGTENLKLILLSPAGKSYGEAKMKLLKWFQAYTSKPIKRREFEDALYNVLIKQVNEPGTEELETLEALDEPSELEELAYAESYDHDLGVNGMDPVAVTTIGTAGVAAAKRADSGENAAHTVLIAEDHFVNQQLFQTILEKMGYQTLCASDGLEAVELAARNTCDLIFMDVQMPNLNGYEATKRIREAGNSVPIVAVTANALKGERERCTEAGMNDYLTKPFKGPDLVPFLKRYLKTEKSDRKRAAAEEPVAPTIEAVDEPIGVPFDYGAAVAAFMGKSDVVKRVVNEFQRKVEQQLIELQHALDAEDFSKARTAAHGIKGGAWNLEARPLGDAAEKLEDAARAEDDSASRTALDEMTQRFTEFRKYCEQLEELQLS